MNNENVSAGTLPDVLNNFFISVGNGVPSLDLSKLEVMRQKLGAAVPQEFIVYPFEVFTEVSKISLQKSSGPDLVPNKILKELSFMLAEPICAIFNSSVRHGKVPDC